MPGAVPGEELGRPWLGKPKFLNGQQNGHVDFANNWRVGFHNGHVDLAHSACGSRTLGMWTCPFVSCKKETQMLNWE